MKIKEAVLCAHIMIYIGRNTEGDQYPAGLDVLLRALKKMWRWYDMEGFPSPDHRAKSRKLQKADCN